MYIVTTLSHDELGKLIRDKKVSLNNAALLFGYNVDMLNKYFSDSIGYDGYVVGLRGRINPTTAEVFSNLDHDIEGKDRVILEAEIDESDMVSFSVSGVSKAAEALAYGLPESDIREQLDGARDSVNNEDSVEVICVPYIQANGKVRVTSLSDELDFNLEGITFVKLK